MCAYVIRTLPQTPRLFLFPFLTQPPIVEHVQKEAATPFVQNPISPRNKHNTSSSLEQCRIKISTVEVPSTLNNHIKALHPVKADTTPLKAKDTVLHNKDTAEDINNNNQCMFNSKDLLEEEQARPELSLGTSPSTLYVL